MRTNIVLLTVLAIGVMATSCKNECVITGTVYDDLDLSAGDCAVLMNANAEEVVRSEIIDRHFQFSIEIDGMPYSVTLSGEGKELYDERYYVNIISEKGPINISIGKGIKDNLVKGGRVSESLNAFQRGTMEIMTDEEGSRMMREAYEAGDMAAVDSISSATHNKMLSFLEKSYTDNLDNYVGIQALMLLVQYQQMNYAEMQNIVDMGGDYIKNNDQIQSLLKMTEVAEKVTSGAKYTDIPGVDIDGKEVRLSDYAGKGDYVLLDFWASWCEPCKQIVPVLKYMVDNYTGKNFRVVGINLDESRKDGISSAKEQEMAWPVIYADQTVGETYGIKAIPTSILISPDGTIVERLEGAAGDMEGIIAKYFE